MSDSPRRPVIASLGLGITPKEKGSKARILVVDPDPAVQRLMSTRLGAANYTVAAVSDAQTALDACVRDRPHLVITDWQLEGMDGLSLLRELKSRWPALCVIFVTAYGSIPEAVKATQNGAFGFLVKPVEKAELLGQVQRAIAESTFALTDGDWRAGIVSRGKLMEERLGQANWAAGSGAPVLLTGENGTGKELFARAIHAASARRGAAFISVNCRGSAEEMLETELFGDSSDAVAAAEKSRSGAIRAARGGTLLLAEIGDLSARLQAKLCDLLLIELADDGRHQTPTDVRLICTTSCDLKQLMEAGKFREDLYYRINIMPIEIPPLGRRREDIPLLVSHFLEQATEQGGDQKIYSPEAIELLATADWPGNVRQLFDLVKQNVALSRGAVMTKAFVQQSFGTEAIQSTTLDEARNRFAHDYLSNMLQATSGNVTESARLAKRNRSDFYRLLTRHRVRAENMKNAASTKGHDEE
jgi:two-component system response regulator GlrR